VCSAMEQPSYTDCGLYETASQLLLRRLLEKKYSMQLLLFFGHDSRDQSQQVHKYHTRKGV
ncbi:MAG: hypothetical protein ABF649_22975, partial [Bacillus sp. (in: firmicutes)]